MTDQTHPSDPPPSTEPAGSTTPSTWRAGDDAPTWARGRTAEEILGIAQQRESYLMGSLQQLANQQAAPPPPPPAPASTPIADDDYLTGRQFRDAVNQYGQNMGTALSGAYERVAELALDRLRSNYPTDFQKWGGEILSKIQSLPLHLRTLDTMETIVKLVRSEHLDEIAQMRAQELVSSGNLTLRSNGSAGGYPGGSGPGNPLESEKLDAGLRARLQRQGVTLETVREFCAKNGQTVESWLADAEKAGSGVIVDRGGMR